MFKIGFDVHGATARFDRQTDSRTLKGVMLIARRLRQNQYATNGCIIIS